MAELQINDKVEIEGGADARVVARLGEGGQGIVYKVEFHGEQYALKWYYTYKINDIQAFKGNLKHNIAKGPPLDAREAFLWPLFLAENSAGGFGYLMELREKSYAEFADVLLNKAPMHIPARINAALNLVQAFRALHNVGYSYQDLNDGNFFMEPKSGCVRICDNDNVIEHGRQSGIAGKPGYMAPEIVRGEAQPNRRTDQFSLAVILFRLFFMADPLKGEKVYRSLCLTTEAEIEHYGRRPVFIMDPSNGTNRPVSGVNDYVVRYWNEFPPFLHELFVEAFGPGMMDPDQRVELVTWQKTLVRLRDEWTFCVCGHEAFFNDFSLNNSAFKCRKCSAAYSAFPVILNAASQVRLLPNAKLFGCLNNVDGVQGFEQQIGVVVVNPKDPRLWGIRNLSDAVWTVNLPDGQIKEYVKNEVVPISNGKKINLGKETVTISL